MSEETKVSAASMQRTKIQLGTIYAPGSLFTFEGNLVVCESRPKDFYHEAAITNYTEIQILNGIKDRVQAWYQAGMRSTNEPQPFMCVDPNLLNEAKTNLRDKMSKNLFAFAVPDEMGYSPALLTMVCNRCKRTKAFESLINLERRKEELAPENCEETESSGQCAWRQMDVVFIHPNGNYIQPLPWVYDYSELEHDVYKNFKNCPRCGYEQVKIEEKSAQIGKRYYYCANCNMKRGKEDRWLQNDKEWLRHFKGESFRHISDIRMKAISYRSNAVHYTQQDMIIDFGKSQQLDILTEGSDVKLLRLVAERFKIPIVEPSLEAVMKAVIETRGEEEWKRYKSTEESINAIRATMEDQSSETVVESMRLGVEMLEKDLEQIRRDWQKEGVFETEVHVPDRLQRNLLSRRELFATRYDPFRLLVEHKTLLERIISDHPMDNGMRHYTAMDRLDEYVGPEQKEERNKLNSKHRVIMDNIGIETIGLARKFETLQYSFGFTRVDSNPTTTYINEREVPVRLKLFDKTLIGEDRKHPIFVLKQNNEAIYVRLDETAVREWLLSLDTFETLTEAPIGQQYLEHVPSMSMFLDTLPNPTKPSMPLALYTLLHSYSHHVMMAISEFSGLGTGSLGEYLFPGDLAFIVYRRGMTMDMGNLTSMLRNNAPAFLKYLQDPRNLGCGSGSLCLSRGGACPDCLLIPEVNCLTQNKLLSRTVLIGKDSPRQYGFHEPVNGFFEVARKE